VPRRGWPELPEDLFASGPFVPVATGVPDHAYEDLPDPTGHRYGPVSETPAWRPLPELVVWVRRSVWPPLRPRISAAAPAASTRATVVSGTP